MPFPTMRAIVMESFGEPEVLKLVEVPAPDPAPDELAVAVEAVSINRSFDLLVRRDGNNRDVVLPHVLGADPAGTVVAVGADVDGYSPGDRVAVSSTIRCENCRECRDGDEAACRRSVHIGVDRWGGYAERVAVPASNAHRIPEGMSAADACVIVRHAPAAYNQLIDKTALRPGEWVLVMGAAGALGSFCVQVAKALGGKVIAAAGSDGRVEAALSLGADHGVNYRANDLADTVRGITGGEGVDVVCENIGDPGLWDGAFDSMAQRGRLVTMGAHGGGRVGLDVRKLYAKRLRLIGSAGVTKKNIDDALAAGSRGALTALIDSIHPLDAAAAQHRRLEEDRSIVGKVILDPTLAA